jgi:hypothetical protein
VCGGVGGEIELFVIGTFSVEVYSAPIFGALVVECGGAQHLRFDLWFLVLFLGKRKVVLFDCYLSLLG